MTQTNIHNKHISGLPCKPQSNEFHEQGILHRSRRTAKCMAGCVISFTCLTSHATGKKTKKKKNNEFHD